MNVYLEKFIKEKFSQPGKALDLGAGDGADVTGLEQQGWQAYGVDLKTGVDLNRSYLSEHRPFDLVYSNFLLHKLKNRKQLIKTAYDNLSQGSWFFLQTFDRSDENSSSDLTEDSVVDLLTEVGFKDIFSRIFSLYDDEPGHNHWHRVLEASARKR